MLIGSPQTVSRLRKIRGLGRGVVLLLPVQAGGPGSGCHGPNCGRPSSGKTSEPVSKEPSHPFLKDHPYIHKYGDYKAPVGSEAKTWTPGRRVDYVTRNGKAWVDRMVAHDPQLQDRMRIATEAERRHDAIGKSLDRLGEWNQRFWAMSQEEREQPRNVEIYQKVNDRMVTLLEKAGGEWQKRADANREASQMIAAKIFSEDPRSIPQNRRLGISSQDPKTGQNLGLEPWTEGAIRDLEKLIGGSPIADQTLRFLPTSAGGHGAYYERSYYMEGEKTIYLRENAGKETVWHEMGHWLEHVLPGARGAAVSYLESRTKGEAERKLKNIGESKQKYASWTGQGIGVGYEDHEVAKPDDFLHPYVGKIYRDGATEVTSMGLQYLSEDPARFYRMDRDHFNFTLGMIRAARAGGFPWAKPKKGAA